jgi:cobalt-zinc-cadmium efflux system membrane fusion protein
VGDTAVIELPAANTHGDRPFDHPEPRSREQDRDGLVLTPQGAAQLTAGQGVRVRSVPRSTERRAHALPEEAVQTVEGRDVVFVATAKGFQATEVVTGKRSGGRIEIVAG